MSVANLLRLMVVVLALACQVTASGAFPAAESGSALAAASILCQGTHHKSGQDAPVPHRHVVDQAMLGLADVHAKSALLLESAAWLPRSLAGSIGQAVTRPRARAPPARHVSASFPRGPPNLV